MEKFNIVNADMFENAVIGNSSPFAISFENGDFVLSAYGATKSKQQNLKLISDVIRNSNSVPQDILNWIADLFDPKTKGNYKIKNLTKNGKGAKSAHGAHDHRIAMQFNYLMHEESKRLKGIDEKVLEFESKLKLEKKRVTDIKDESQKYRAGLTKNKITRERAIDQVCKMFKVSRSTVEAALAEDKAMWETPQPEDPCN
jgi:hypothetical protein